METGTFKRSASYAILLLLAVGARAQFTSYPQPSSTAELPQDSVTQYSGNFCYCDLTAHACDSNCCCDTACTPEDQLLFTSCTQETSTAPELNYCIDEALVATVQLLFVLVLAQQASSGCTGSIPDFGDVATGQSAGVRDFRCCEEATQWRQFGQEFVLHRGGKQSILWQLI